MKKLTDIRAIRLHKAGKLLGPVLGDIYDKNGLDLTTMLLLYYAARGIVMSVDLTDDVKNKKINEMYKNLSKAIKVLKKLDKQKNIN